MEIDVLIEDGVPARLDAERLRGVAKQVLKAQGVGPEAAMGLVIATGERIRQLNRGYLGKDRPTDVIAFAMLPEDGEKDSFVMPPDGVKHLGEVIVSYPQAAIQADEQGHSVDRELTILIIHGILHLLGYDDQETGPKRRMNEREAEILSRIEGGKP